MAIKVPDLVEIPDVALAAIQKGLDENHYVCSMEDLGLPQRTINLLENNGIMKLRNLLETDKEDLLRFKNFGEQQLILLFECLARYHTMPE